MWREGAGEDLAGCPGLRFQKARGLGLMAGQRGANQGPIMLSSARPGLAGDRLSETARKARLKKSEVQGSSESVFVRVCLIR